MACYHPSTVHVSPIQAPERAGAVTVPCGHCLGCRADQARGWAVRLMHEAQTREAAFFLTLTYEDEELPPNGSLRAEDLSAFFKRLRKRFPSRSLSYFGAGEYGPKTDRPHYHSVLCGPALLDRELVTVRNGAPVWVSQTIDDAWGLGIHELTAVTYPAAQYVAGYVRKKVRRKDDPEHYCRVDPGTGEIIEIPPEGARMSRRPALGRLWLERYWQDVYPRDFVVMNGVPMKPPRYYDKLMEVINPQIMEEVRHQRWLDAEEIGDDKLIMKEKIHRAKVALFSRRDAV